MPIPATPSPRHEQVSIDSALDTPGFAEFLAQHPNSEKIDMANEVAIQEYFATFEEKELVTKGIKEVYAKQIQEEMGIKLSAADLESIDEFFVEQATTDLEGLHATREKLDMFRTLPQEIKKYGAQLQQIGNVAEITLTRDALTTDKENLETLKNKSTIVNTWRYASLFARQTLRLVENIPGISLGEGFTKGIEGTKKALAEQSEAIEAASEKYGRNLNAAQTINLLGIIDRQIAEAEQKLNTIKGIEPLKAAAQLAFADVRKGVLGGMADIQVLTETIQKKAQQKLNDLVSNKDSLKNLDQAQEDLTRLQEAGEVTETGVDPLEDFDVKDFQKKLDKLIADRTTEEISTLIMQAKMGKNALTQLEKDLKPFLEKENVGSREGSEARAFIIGALEEATAGVLGDTPEDQAKKLIVARIIIKAKRT